MKKQFPLTDDKIKAERLVEAAKGNIRKYLKRERNKATPDSVDYWDFDCAFGKNPESAQPIHTGEIIQSIDLAKEKQYDSFYIQILAKPAHWTEEQKRKRGIRIENSEENSQPVNPLYKGWKKDN